MSDSIAEMSKAEFRDLIESVVEQKLIELLGDPDTGLELRKAVRTRLERQTRATAGGERGRAMEEVVSDLDLE